MRRAIVKSVFLLFLFSILFSCKKLDVKEPSSENVSSAVSMMGSAVDMTSSDCDVTVCEDCSFQETIANDTTEYATVLGETYSNPYSISNMTSAYNNIHGTNVSSVGTTHYYVRFKPQTETHLNILDSLDLELFDYPLDRVVVQEGDYWPAAYTGLGQNEYPWLYTVVESNFQFPNGITYENLGSLNIPDDDALLEDKAFSLTGNLECGEETLLTAKSNPTNDQFTSNPSPSYIPPDCGQGNHWDYSLRECVYDGCPPGYHWDYSIQDCVQDSPPPPPPPTFLYPKGMITFKTYDDYGVVPPSAPLRYTRIVARRFFKIDKTYTDANGNFQLSKRFPKKVTIVVKFRTSSVTIKKWPLIPIVYGLSQMKKNIGTYKGNDLRNLNYEFQKGSTSTKRKTRNWIAAVGLNTSTETQGFLSANNLIQLPQHFYIYLPEIWQETETAQYEFIRNSGFDPKSSVILNWKTSNVNSITTSKLTINVAQQLGLLYLNRVNEASEDGFNMYNGYWRSYEYVKIEFNDNQLAYEYYPFGTGIPHPNQGYYPDIVAMWQSFAQHLGHTIANRVFGYGETVFQLQGKTWTSGGGVSSSTKYLEGFDPSIGVPSEYFKWIPIGLINDLMDNTPDAAPVVDNVSGFTYPEIQSVYYLEPDLMSSFKIALKNIKPSQSTAIDQLFASYGY